MPNHTHTFVPRAVRALAAFGLGVALGCDSLDVTDPNNPGLETLRDAPTRSSVTTAASGILVGARLGIAGLHSQLGIFGRENYLLSSDDPRLVAELLAGPLQPGAFGGGHFAQRYANIRLENVVLSAVDQVSAFSDAEKSGIKGFARTMQALDLLQVIELRDSFGAPIDVDIDPTAAPAPVAARADVYARIVSLLTTGATDLQAAGTSFAFRLSEGFAGFDTPATFLTFNRALRARVAINLNDFAGTLTALQGSFLSTTAPLTRGTYHSFGTGSGDTQNGSFDPTGRSLRGHLSFMNDAQRSPGGTLDLRTSKQAQAAAPLTVQNVTSSRLVTVYDDASDPIPIIRNEELILLRAEANIGLGNLNTALADINLIRNQSGGLGDYTGPVTAAALLDELLYNKRYSLYFEGRRWIDLRRYNRLGSLPRDLPTHRVFTQWPFPLNECLSRGLNSGACGPVTGS